MVKIATWNVRDLYENKSGLYKDRTEAYNANISKLVNILKEEEINITALSETKRIGTGCEDIGSGYKMFYRGLQEGDPKSGIAVILDPTWKHLIIDCPIFETDRINERIMLVELNSKSLGWRKNIMVIAIYAPVNKENNRSETNNFYDDLKAVIEDKYDTQSHYLALMGDFNGRIGDDIREYSGVKGEFGNPQDKNHSGNKLMELASNEDLNLKIANTYFSDTINYTYLKEKSLLDYIVVDHEFFDMVQTTKILVDQTMVDDIWTDHYMVYSIISDPLIEPAIRESPIQEEKPTTLTTIPHQKESYTRTLTTFRHTEESNTSTTAADVLVGIAVVGAGLAAGVAAFRYFMSSGSDSESDSRNRSRSSSSSNSRFNSR